MILKTLSTWWWYKSPRSIFECRMTGAPLCSLFQFLYQEFVFLYQEFDLLILKNRILDIKYWNKWYNGAPYMTTWSWFRKHYALFFPFENVLPNMPVKNHSPFGRGQVWPRNFICANMNLLVPRMLHANLKCIPASSSWEDFLSFFLYMTE